MTRERVRAMSDIEKSIMDKAADKLLAEIEAIKAETGGDNRKKQTRLFAAAVGKMLVSFCYQSEDFAAAVLERDVKLFPWVIETVAKHWTTGIKDEDAYAAAAKYYAPEARVRPSFRIEMPKETDDDLFDIRLGTETEEGHGAIILDLFGVGESSPEGEVSPREEV